MDLIGKGLHESLEGLIRTRNVLQRPVELVPSSLTYGGPLYLVQVELTVY